MEGKRIFLGVIFIAIVLIALLHTIFHFAVYGTGIRGIYEFGVSGFTIGKLQLGEEIKSNYPQIPIISKIVLILEWFIVITIVTFTFVRQKINLKKEIKSLNVHKNYGKSKTKTDLDVLYSILKEKKHLKLSTVSKVFKIDKDKVMEWCRILESGNLAEINYPGVGEPEIVINEDSI